jgi:hypothetical protein
MSKPNLVATSSLAELTIEQKRTLLEDYLKNLATFVVSEAEGESSARTAIYDELEKQIDGDDNALVDIFSTKIENLNGNIDFANALAPFSNLEGDKYFPQVFIYNYDQLKSDGKIGNDSKILVAFYTGDETMDKVPGYELDSENNWTFVADVDDSVAAGKEVWIFSLNETFRNTIDFSILPRETAITGPVMKPTGPSGGPCDDDIHYWPYIQNMQVRQHNESWLAGKSDIWITTYTGWDTYQSINPCNSALDRIMSTNNPQGEIFVKKFMRYLIPNGAQDVNCGYAGSWCPGPANVGG